MYPALDPQRIKLFHDSLQDLPERDEKLVRPGGIYLFDADLPGGGAKPRPYHTLRVGVEPIHH